MRGALVALLLASPAWAQTVEGVGPMGPPGPAGAASTVPGPAGKDGADSKVPGPAGKDGAASTVSGPQGPAGPAGGSVVGPKGDAGSAGPGYTSAVVNGAGHLIVTKTDGVTVDLGNVQGGVGATGASIAGPVGPAGIVPFYNAAGLIPGVKCWQGTVTTTTGGAWAANYASAGFAAAPNVQSQAVSPSVALAGLLFSTMTAPTTTTVSGVTALAGIGGLGAAGAVVQVRACGS